MRFNGDVHLLVTGAPADAALGVTMYLRLADADLFAGMARGVAAIVREFELAPCTRKELREIADEVTLDFDQPLLHGSKLAPQLLRTFRGLLPTSLEEDYEAEEAEGDGEGLVEEEEEEETRGDAEDAASPPSLPPPPRLHLFARTAPFTAQSSTQSASARDDVAPASATSVTAIKNW